MPDDVMDDAADVDVAVDTPEADVAEEDTTSEDTAVSEDEETPAADDVADDTDEDTEDTPDGSEVPAKGSSAKLDKLLGKYGGDPDKMVDAYFEQANSMSRLFNKLTDLEKQLEAQKSDPAAEEKFVAADPDVKEYATELASLDAEIKSSQAEQTNLIADYGKLDKEIAKLEGQLEKAPFEEKDSVQRLLDKAEAKKEKLENAWKNSQRDLARLQKDIRAAARAYKQAEGQAKMRREREKQQELESVRNQQLTQQTFNTTVQAEAAQYGLKPDSKTYAIVQQAVKDRLVGYLRTLPPGSPGINIPVAVKKLMAEYADALELKQRFSQASKRKVETLTPKPGTGKVASSGKSPSPKDASYWRQRAARIASGG
jgi:hypothetical protein